MTPTLVTSAGTVLLRGNAVQFCEIIAELQVELDPIRFGSLEFHFAGPKIAVKVIKSHLIRRGD